jgi:hypothetical protein
MEVDSPIANNNDCDWWNCTWPSVMDP